MRGRTSVPSMGPLAIGICSGTRRRGGEGHRCIKRPPIPREGGREGGVRLRSEGVRLHGIMGRGWFDPRCHGFIAEVGVRWIWLRRWCPKAFTDAGLCLGPLNLEHVTTNAPTPPPAFTVAICARGFPKKTFADSVCWANHKLCLQRQRQNQSTDPRPPPPPRSKDPLCGHCPDLLLQTRRASEFTQPQSGLLRRPKPTSIPLETTLPPPGGGGVRCVSWNETFGGFRSVRLPPSLRPSGERIGMLGMRGSFLHAV